MYFFRCTEDKLGHHLDRIAQAGDTLVQAVYKGGRDWVLFCKKSDQPTSAAPRAMCEPV